VISRRAFLGSLAGGLRAAPLAAEAQQARKVYRVGRLAPSVLEPQSFEAFKRRLEDRGWNLGRDLLLEPRWADEQPDRLTTFAAEMVNMKVDVIVALGDGAIEAARRATSTIPIVMAVATDAVERGFVASLARPGNNLTDLSAFAPELAGKRIQLLKELVPSVRRVGVLSLPIAFTAAS
jgi:putative ABC transport system substrate-binding protein